MKIKNSQNPNISAWLNDSLSPREFKDAFASSHRDSASNLDQISYRMLE